MARPVAEEFGRYKGQISWSVAVFWAAKHYSYRIHLGGKTVNASRENPEGLTGTYENPAEALTAGRHEALRLAAGIMQTRKS